MGPRRFGREPPSLYDARVRVHVYVDGFNLYNGGRELAGNAPGWKWLDIRSFAQALADEQWPGRQPEVQRVVYCTTLIHRTVDDPDAPRRQKTFINALRSAGSVDTVEYGLFIEKVKTRPLATKSRRGRPKLVTSQVPVFVKDARNRPVREALFFVSVADREEKGSDVNVATHLLLDALREPPAMDAAVVVSNDSDLKLPISEVRRRMPVGIVNPGRGYTAGALEHDPDVHVEGQWERQVTVADMTAHQLTDPVGPHTKPEGW
jgi:hypothetical protein